MSHTIDCVVEHLTMIDCRQRIHFVFVFGVIVRNVVFTSYVITKASERVRKSTARGLPNSSRLPRKHRKMNRGVASTQYNVAAITAAGVIKFSQCNVCYFRQVVCENDDVTRQYFYRANACERVFPCSDSS